MGKEVEVLKDHSHVAALPAGLGIGHETQLALVFDNTDQFIVDTDGSSIDAFEVVEAPQNSALARTGGPEQTDDLARLNAQRDAA